MHLLDAPYSTAAPPQTQTDTVLYAHVSTNETHVVPFKYCKDLEVNPLIIIVLQSRKLNPPSCM